MVNLFERKENMKSKIDILIELGKKANLSPDFYDHLEDIKKELENIKKLKEQDVK
jgi:hypothetical protein